MSAPESAGPKALGTGATCGIRPAAARLPAFRGARTARPGLTPDDVPEPLTGISADAAGGGTGGLPVRPRA
ncbi:hypothetical protein ACIP98_34480 [Streptomyces sp. NPDC088354]|uniref:hypothetical protein n=1 Tax=Streptomyces sp. NPDC088354 TaxID=3365856 RepID=UPI00380FAC65